MWYSLTQGSRILWILSSCDAQQLIMSECRYFFCLRLKYTNYSSPFSPLSLPFSPLLSPFTPLSLPFLSPSLPFSDLRISYRNSVVVRNLTSPVRKPTQHGTLARPWVCCNVTYCTRDSSHYISNSSISICVPYNIY